LFQPEERKYKKGNFGHFVAQKVHGYSKIAQTAFWGRLEAFYAN
jgi:hypothetical protein